MNTTQRRTLRVPVRVCFFLPHNVRVQINNVRSDRIALNLDEQGELSVGDTVISTAKDDVVIMPRNTEYDYHAKLRLFLCMYVPLQESSNFPNGHPPSY